MATHAAKEDVFERKGDRRYKQDPVIKEVAYLSVEKSAGWTRGTGFLVKVEGQFIVLTAAHCLYDDETRDVAVRVEVYFGRTTEDECPSVTKVFKDIYVHPLYRPTDGGNSEQDFGFIFLGKKDSFQGFEPFELMFLDTEKLSKQSKASALTGYPAERSPDAPEKHQQYSVKLSNITCHPKRRFLTYKDATSGGMSGSPLYFTSAMGRLAFAIHVNAENGAVWITKDEISFIEKAVLRAASGETVGWQHHDEDRQEHFGLQAAEESAIDCVREKMNKLDLYREDKTDQASKPGRVTSLDCEDKPDKGSTIKRLSSLDNEDKPDKGSKSKRLSSLDCGDKTDKGSKIKRLSSLYREDKPDKGSTIKRLSSLDCEGRPGKGPKTGSFTYAYQKLKKFFSHSGKPKKRSTKTGGVSDSSQTSWQAYIDTMAESNIDMAGIFGKNGVPWATSCNFSPSPDEVGVLVDIIENNNQAIFATGVLLSGKMWTAILLEKDSAILILKGKESDNCAQTMVIGASNQALIMGGNVDGVVSAGSVRNSVQRLRDYLKSKQF